MKQEEAEEKKPTPTISSHLRWTTQDDMCLGLALTRAVFEANGGPSLELLRYVNNKAIDMVQHKYANREELFENFPSSCLLASGVLLQGFLLHKMVPLLDDLKCQQQNRPQKRKPDSENNETKTTETKRRRPWRGSSIELKRPDSVKFSRNK